MSQDLNAEQSEEATTLISQIIPYQGTQSDRAFCKRYQRYIGKSDLWARRLKSGDFSQVSPKRLPLLRSLLELLHSGADTSDIYTDLPFYRDFQDGIKKIEREEQDDRRIFAVLASIGVGKTRACAGALSTAETGGRERILIRVPITWRENKGAIVHGIARALDCDNPNRGADPLLAACVNQLANRQTLIFDEAHQGGVMLMRLIKDLVNASIARFVYVALRTEYARVIQATSANLFEARQFVRRCVQPIFSEYAAGTPYHLNNPITNKEEPGDFQVFLNRRLGWELNDEVDELIRDTIDHLQGHGNLSTLADAVDLAEEKKQKGRGPLKPEDIKVQIERICGKAPACRTHTETN